MTRKTNRKAIRDPITGKVTKWVDASQANAATTTTTETPTTEKPKAKSAKRATPKATKPKSETRSDWDRLFDKTPDEATDA